MPKTKIVAEFMFPHTATDKVDGVMKEVRAVLHKWSCNGTFFTYSGPWHDNQTRGEPNGTIPDNRGTDGSTGGRERPEHQRQAAADFADGADEGAGDEAGRDPGTASDGKPGRKPRSDAGQPRKPRGAAAGKEAGQAAEEPERGAGRSRSEGRAGRDGNGGAPEGRQRGGGEGQDADGGTRRGGRPPRRSDVGDGQAAEVAAADEAWGSEPEKPEPFVHPTGEEPAFDTFEEAEEWWCKTPDEDGWPDNLMPEEPVTKSVLITVMSEHFQAATNGKDRGPTKEILMDVTGVADPTQVDERDMDNAVRALLRDAAKYRYGLKKYKKPPASK